MLSSRLFHIPRVFVLALSLARSGFSEALSVSPQLTPLMRPEQIVHQQLAALRDDNMERVFFYASPNNKANVGSSVERFGAMVRGGPYRFLIRHDEPQILLTVTSRESDVRWQGLVRVACADEHTANGKLTAEYWWLLSRCREGDNRGCFMVDAVIPNH